MNKHLKKFFKSKTIIFSIMLAFFGALEMKLNIISQYMSQDVFGLFTIFIAVVVAILRVLTTLPLDKK